MEYEFVRPGKEGQECKMQVLDSQNQSLGSKRPLRAEKVQGSSLLPRVSPSLQHATYWKGLTSLLLSNFFEKDSQFCDPLHQDGSITNGRSPWPYEYIK